MGENESRFTVSIRLNEEGNENNITIERNCDSGCVSSSDVMGAVLDAMNGLTFRLSYEDELRDMIEESRPNY